MHRLRARVDKIRETFWVLPALAITAGIVGGLALPAVDPHVTLPDAVSFSGDEETARSVLAAVATIGVSTAGVSFSVIVVALVLASQQLSPRVLRSFQGQALNQSVLAMLLGTAAFALFTLGALDDGGGQPLPELSVTLAMLLTAASMGLFVVFLHHAVRSLNASVVIRRIAANGQAAVRKPYPAGVGEEAGQGARWAPAGPPHEVRAPRAGYVSTVDGERLLRCAVSVEGFVEQRRGVGDFAVTGALLAVVYSHDDVETDEFACAFQLREEREIDGDVAFPVRQLADIALKGLSPGINDPTTAENAMDSVTDMLVRYAREDRPTPLRIDEHGTARLLAVVPTLDDIVRLGFDQVRRDASSRPSFAVRLLELLADLREAAPAAAGSEEIARQARLIAAHAGAVAELEADQELVMEAFQQLHGDQMGGNHHWSPALNG